MFPPGVRRGTRQSSFWVIPPSSGCSKLSYRENPLWRMGGPRLVRLCVEGSHLQKMLLRPPAPCPQIVPYCSQLAYSGRDGSLGQKSSFTNFPTYWLCNLRRSIVFSLGFSFLICSMGAVNSETVVTGIWCTFTLGRVLCLGMMFSPGKYFYPFLWTGKPKLNWWWGH